MPSGRPYRCPRSFGPRSTQTASSLPQTPSITCAELLLIEKLRVLVSRPHSWCCQLRRRKTSRLPTATNTAWAEKALTYEHSHSGKLRDSHSGCLRTARVPTEGLCCAVRSGPAHPEKTGEPFRFATQPRAKRLSLSGWHLSRLSSHNKGRV